MPDFQHKRHIYNPKYEEQDENEADLRFKAHGSRSCSRKPVKGKESPKIGVGKLRALEG